MPHRPFALVLLLLVSTSLPTNAQDKPKLELPECDIFLFDLTSEDGKLAVTNPRNITQRPGYDNQPWFTPQSKSILFTADRVANRTDVYEYVIASGETKTVTDSPDQEYSPQISSDNETLSFVTDGATANQSVWFQKRGEKKPQWLLSSMGEREPVGYYSWNHKTDNVLFWSRYGFCMRLVHRGTGKAHYICGNAVPSSPYIIPGTNNFSFVHRQGNGTVWIKELNPENRAIRPLVQLPGANANYGWTPDGKLLNIDGSDLKTASPKEGEWEVVADLTKFKIEKATRVAVSPNGKLLAIVGTNCVSQAHSF